jgi:hypothetical protein
VSSFRTTVNFTVVLLYRATVTRLAFLTARYDTVLEYLVLQYQALPMSSRIHVSRFGTGNEFLSNVDFVTTVVFILAVVLLSC